MSNHCDVDDRDESGDDDDDGKQDRAENLWFYFVVALGFGTGFWVFIGVLLLKKGWRYAYFKFIEVTFQRQIAKLKKRSTINPVD